MVELGRTIVEHLRSLLRGADAAYQRSESCSEAEACESDAAILLEDLCPKDKPEEWPEDAAGRGS